MRDNINQGFRDKRGGSPLLYDARGVKQKSSPLSNNTVRTLLFFVLPYIVINLIVFLLVTSAPKITVVVDDTDNYRDTEVHFSVRSLMPVKNLEVSMESEPVYYEKQGNNYTCVVGKNGTLFIHAEAANGMTKASYTEIGMLDDTPPVIDEYSCTFNDGNLTFTITDNQSGVNFDTIYGIYDNDKNVLPVNIDRTLGKVTIPMEADDIELHFSDMVGNERTGRITATSVVVMKDENGEEVVIE